jgi:hypothetical protein
VGENPFVIVGSASLLWKIEDKTRQIQNGRPAADAVCWGVARPSSTPA